jgi:hypothetical protein
MAESAAYSVRWNIFARELESILAAHGWELGHLDDRGVVYNREKVRRLQKSLISPGHLATLNPDEMQRLIDILQLDEFEQKRLRASLLATAVERTLLDRVNKDVAFTASQQVYAVLLGAMEEDPTRITGIKGYSTFIDEGNALDDSVAGRVVYLLDRAILLLHIARGAPTRQARLTNAQEANDVVTHVLRLLREHDHESDEWPNWWREAELVQQMAEEVLASARSEGETK